MTRNRLSVMTRNRLSVMLLCCFVSLGVLLPSVYEKVCKELEQKDEPYEKAPIDSIQPEICPISQMLEK